MKNKKILLLVGIPASGKTTWKEKFLFQNDNYVSVTRDDFRYMLRNSGWLEPKGEKLVTELVEQAIIRAINSKYNVIVDQTNVNIKTLVPFVEFCEKLADVEFQIFDIPYDVAVERDLKRKNSVGEIVIEKMYQNYLNLFESNFDFSTRKKKPLIIENIEWDINNPLPKAVIYDVDGTLAHNNGKRGYFNWNKVYVDVVDEKVRETLNVFKNSGYKIIIVTGRDGSCEELTKNWLKTNNIHFDQFFMRQEDDFRKDTVIKKEIYNNHIKDNFNILGVFDDREKVVSMWRELGLKCYQVIDGLY